MGNTLRKETMKKCYWCEIAELTDEENQHPDEEVGGIDCETGKWICDDCCDVAEQCVHLTAASGAVDGDGNNGGGK